MATMEKLLELGNAPVICLDGAFGMVIQYGEDEIGVQVPGEDDIRWIAAERVNDLGGGALVEVEAAP
jgi:hypothetical protein